MLHFKILNLETWPDLQSLFGEKGASGGCWCMYWRLTYKDYKNNKGHNNKSALLNRIKQNSYLGVLAFLNNAPIGWCSISPKNELKRLENSRFFKSTENNLTWSITCLFIDKNYRDRGVSTKLIAAASKYAFENGASEIEAYPIIPKATKTPSVFAWVGFVNSYFKAGFEMKTQPSENRLIMHLERRSE